MQTVLGVLNDYADNALYKSTHSLTHLLTHRVRAVGEVSIVQQHVDVVNASCQWSVADRVLAGGTPLPLVRQLGAATVTDQHLPSATQHHRHCCRYFPAHQHKAAGRKTRL